MAEEKSKQRIKTLFTVDVDKIMTEQDQVGHNRWHPDIPALFSVDQGESFRLECKDWTDGQIKNNDDPSDIRNIDLERVHALSGPVHINGAEPGDLLVVDILDIGTFRDQPWGFGGIFAKENGGSLLVDHFPEANKSIWDFDGIFTSSRHIPDVEFAGILHPGLMGVAPSQKMLDEWNRREGELVATDPNRVPPLANLPTENSAVLGNLKKGPEFDRVAREGARTVPPRENGGNCDIKELSKGSKSYFPVFVDGAKFSVGDLHFSQGDGEITFCGAIEMSGWVELRVNVIKGGMEKYNIKNNPVYEPGPVNPDYNELLVFQGVSVQENGTQTYLDANVAFMNACMNAINYLKTQGYTGEQAYMLLSAAPVQAHLAGVVDIPNTCATIGIPKAIFTKDIMPK